MQILQRMVEQQEKTAQKQPFLKKPPGFFFWKPAPEYTHQNGSLDVSQHIGTFLQSLFLTAVYRKYPRPPSPFWTEMQSSSLVAPYCEQNFCLSVCRMQLAMFSLLAGLSMLAKKCARNFFYLERKIEKLRYISCKEVTASGEAQPAEGSCWLGPLVW